MKLYPLIIAGILGAATVSQGTVTITNAGFELPAHTANDGTNPTGWTVFETALGGSPDKQIRTRNNYKNTGSMGVQVGAGNSTHDGELYQTVATVIGQEYTFSIYAAATSGSASPATQNFTVELLAGTAVAGAPATGASLNGNSLSQLATVSDGGTLGATFQEFTVNFTATSIDTTIWIYDNSTAAANDVNDIILDDVSITAVVPPATITWEAATSVSANSDVSTAGALVEAFNAGDNDVADQTVNGVLFAGTGGLLSSDAVAAAFTGDTGDTAYNALLGSIDYGDGGDLFTISVGSGNLVVGEEYLIQVWYVDTRYSGGALRVMQFGDGNGNAVGLASTPGQFVTGTFTATDTNQALSLYATNFGNAHITAYQIRDTTSTPVPTLTTATNGVSAPFTVAVDFTEAVAGLDASDFSVTNGAVTASSLSGSDDHYTVEITPTANGNVTVSLPANSVTDTDGDSNQNSASDVLTVFYLAPDSDQPAAVLSTAASDVFDSFTVQVDFDEAVVGLSLDDFEVENGHATNLFGTGAAYSVEIVPAVSGDVSVTLPANRVLDTDGDGLMNTVSNQLVTNYLAPLTVAIYGGGTTDTPEFDISLTFSEAVSGLDNSDFQITNGTLISITAEARREFANRYFTVSLRASSPGQVQVQLPAGTVAAVATPELGNEVSAVFSTVCSSDFNDVWEINDHASWIANEKTSSNLTLSNGFAEPTATNSQFSSVTKTFPIKRKARSITFLQSPVWENWTSSAADLGPSGASDAPVFVPAGEDDYYFLGLGTGKVYHAWHSTDMVTWEHKGPVTSGAEGRWVTSAEYKDGLFYIYADHSNDHTPHLFIDNDLGDGVAGTLIGAAFPRAPGEHGSDCSLFRDNDDGLFHLIYEDWSPINASTHAWDSPLAGHATSADGFNGFAEGDHQPPIDLRTTPTGSTGTYASASSHRTTGEQGDTIEYQIHLPDQNAYGDWTTIKIGSRYFMFCDNDPAGQSIRMGRFASDSIYGQFNYMGEMHLGHPDPSVGFAEGQFYLFTQQNTDYTSPGPWVDGVEARAGVDTDDDGSIDQWTAWQSIYEAYDYTPGYIRVVALTPAGLDLSSLPEGYGFEFEFRIDNSVVAAASPIMDQVTMTFEPSNFQQWANTNGIPAAAEADHNSNGVPDVIEFSIGQTVVPERQADGTMAVTVVNEAIADGMAVELWFTDDLLESWNVATLTTVGVKLLSDSTDVAGDHVLLFEIFDRNGTSVFWKLVVVSPE